MSNEVATTIESERRLLVERLRGLPTAEWATPTACEGWTVHHVLAHLTIPFLVPVPSMGLAFVRHRSISRGMDAATRGLVTRDPEELLAVLEAHSSSRFRPPGLPLTAPLTDAIGHSSDVRWALGDPVGDWAEPSRVVPMLDFLVGPLARLGFLPRRRLTGLALEAEDVDWAHGRGEPVRGPALLLAMGLLGRPLAVAGLSGPGVAALAR